jgi:hypothetical protein
MLTKRVYVLVTDGIVRQTVEVEQDSDGPSRPVMDDLVEVATPPDWAKRPTPTHVLRWKGFGADPEWEEAGTLGELKTAAIAKTYADVDKVHFDAVGNRATEYQEAEAAARAFAAGGFQGEADDDVHSYAIDNTTGEVQTDQWAAENIIARADAFRAAQKAMRNTRFKRQAEMRAAATPEELMAVVAAWDGFIAGLRAQLGL